ncbi:hypothetical protein [Plastoroseomonas arctica]|uniref:Uncharacterized protein n=1 Tax=Plastoroseomonas arctica TaxID=1509237 RepID=A0AAF1JXV3_9PROT|nr:hypothetical protein [Plastoroseomonas arctica]MBR0656162.1 hypothetical protein [Plastoroseomonas arctica]
MSGSPDFFIGWSSSPPRPLRRFLAVLGAGVMAGAIALGIGLGFAADDPAGPGFGQGGAPVPALVFEERVTGTLTAEPYPVLHLPPSPGLPRGRALLLAGDGKVGVGDVAAMAGQSVAMGGFALRRGDIEMLATGDAPEVVGPGAPVPVERLGRWRITGEICDGKCASGGMRPGIGLAHRACATLCLSGDIPAIFVATAPVEGSAYLLLADAEGRANLAAFRPLVGQRVRLEGEVLRQGAMLVFRADPRPVAP